MNILLSVIYGTSFGEELVLNLITGTKDGIRQSTPYRMRTINGREWTMEPHRLEINAVRGKSITVYDHWIDIPEDAYLYSSAFTDCIRRRKTTPVALSDYAVTARLKVRAPQLVGNQRLMVVGNDKAMGGWDVSKAVPMYEHNYNEWIADIDVTKLSGKTFFFKFVAVDVFDRAIPLYLEYKKEDNALTRFALKALNQAPASIRDQMIELYLKRLNKMLKDHHIDLRVDLRTIDSFRFENLWETVKKYKSKFDDILGAVKKYTDVTNIDD